MRATVLLAALALVAGVWGEVFDVRAFGARGDGRTKDTAAIQRAVDAAHEAGGGTVEVPAGTYLSGSIFLKSFKNLVDFTKLNTQAVFMVICNEQCIKFIILQVYETLYLHFDTLLSKLFPLFSNKGEQNILLPL